MEEKWQEEKREMNIRKRRMDGGIEEGKEEE